ncbi:MAG: phenylacetate--CoA ligase [Alphaproteobacteria bacterium]|nr:phenylacetate--CoA ligase [Alphaproteobacteria bacterium]
MPFEPSRPLSLSFYRALSRQQVLAMQWQKLQRQLAYLAAANPHYRDKLRQARIVPERIRVLADFRHIPFSDKAEFVADQTAEPPFGRRLGIARERVALIAMTSGTSGQGQEVYGRSANDLVMVGYRHWLAFELAGMRPGDLVVNATPSGGVTAGGWGPPEGFRFGGVTVFHLGGVFNTEQIVGLFDRLGGLNALYASTNYVNTLTEVCRRLGFEPRRRLPQLRCLIFAAEGYPPEWAERMAEFWSCPLTEAYGSTQSVGYAFGQAAGAPDRRSNGRGMLHGLEWLNLHEILDPATLQPVKPGEEGELVLTNLDIEASPILRFRTGDRVRYLPHEESRTGLPFDGIEAGHIGRYDDMLKIRGNNVWPQAVDAAVFAHVEVAEYAGNVEVDENGRTDVLVRLALHPQAPEGEARLGLLARIAQTIKARTNVSMRVVEVPRDSLPTFTYKTRRWTDRRQQGYAGKG